MQSFICFCQFTGFGLCCSRAEFPATKILWLRHAKGDVKMRGGDRELATIKIKFCSHPGNRRKPQSVKKIYSIHLMLQLLRLRSKQSNFVQKHKVTYRYQRVTIDYFRLRETCNTLNSTLTNTSIRRTRKGGAHCSLPLIPLIEPPYYINGHQVS